MKEIHVHGNLVHKGVTGIQILHVAAPTYDANADAHLLAEALRDALPPATFAELVAIMRSVDPIPF